VKKLENDIRFKDDLLKAYTTQYKSVNHFSIEVFSFFGANFILK